MLHSKLVVELAVELVVTLAVNLTTANHLMPNLVMSAHFDLPTQTAIEVSAKAVSDKNASTLRILDVAVANTVPASVEPVSKQGRQPRGRFTTTDPRKVAQYSTRQGQEQCAKNAQQHFLVFDDSRLFRKTNKTPVSLTTLFTTHALNC